MSEDSFRDARSDAVISDCGTYRYRLTRTWDVSKPTVAFVMLNPSTADGVDDDPTIRRCLGFAKDWGYGSLVVSNLFGYRSSDPGVLPDCDDPIGPENDEYLREVCAEAERIVVAWGGEGLTELSKVRALKVDDLLEDTLYAFGTVKSGHPNHPLYQPSDAELEEWGSDEL